MKIDVIKKAEEYLESLPQKKFAGEWIRKNDVRQMLIEFFEKEEDKIEILEAHLKNQELEVQRILEEIKTLRTIVVLMHGDEELSDVYQDMVNDILYVYNRGEEE